jgi:hypothetical protein
MALTMLVRDCEIGNDFGGLGELILCTICCLIVRSMSATPSWSQYLGSDQD